MTSEVLRQRAEIEETIAGQTLCDHLLQVVRREGERPAYSDRDQPDPGTGTGPVPGTPWQTLTWAQTREAALALAAGLAAVGLEPGERVALLMPNRVEHVLADLGVVHAGGVPVTLYATLSPDQIGYMAADCDARIAIVDGHPQLAKLQQVLGRLPGLKTIIVRDPDACPPGESYLSWRDLVALGESQVAAEPSAVADRIARIEPGDALTLLYTSGTTGNPKGVIITHHNALYEVAVATTVGTIPEHVRWVSYLPLAHIAERMFSIYLPIGVGGHVHFCRDPAAGLVATLGDVRPTAFFGVPRVWEKVQAGIQGLLATQGPEQRTTVERAMDIGRRYVESRQFGRTTPEELAEEYRQADQSVLQPIRSLLGLGETVAASSAAAPLPLEVAKFFAGLGVKILDVYGMTETTGAFTANREDAFKLGTVGPALAGMEIKVAPDGEILTRGPLNTPGYLNLPEATAELIDSEGWLHTGDVGSLDDDGFLTMVDRKKELIITSGGENISPAAVENLLVEHPLVGQAVAYGDRRRYVVALLTLDGDAAAAWAKAHSLGDISLPELAAHPGVLAEISAAVDAANARLARVQQVKRWRLLPAEWTAESEELTPTLKLKRRIVYSKYAGVIDEMYAGEPAEAPA
ncbi:MAG TPA: AMP-binding protein [Streptosporangiaceae bacterium]|nr:AMP-binding protein [Streptosporangiaceae bacterium]